MIQIAMASNTGRPGLIPYWQVKSNNTQFMLYSLKLNHPDRPLHVQLYRSSSACLRFSA